MPTWVWAVIAAVIVLLIGVALYVSGRGYTRRRAAALRRRFGAEYDRVIAEYGGQRRGEAELRARLRRHQALPLRPLADAEREQFSGAWQSAQTSFVDAPSTGLRDADLLVLQVLRERGYPTEGVEERVKMVSVDHPDLVEHYRCAHAVAVANENENATTEQLRQAMVDFGYLFDDLLQGASPGHGQNRTFNGDPNATLRRRGLRQ
jgi:hypothetical protein